MWVVKENANIHNLIRYSFKTWSPLLRHEQYRWPLLPSQGFSSIAYLLLLGYIPTQTRFDDYRQGIIPSQVIFSLMKIIGKWIPYDTRIINMRRKVKKIDNSVKGGCVTSPL